MASQKHVEKNMNHKLKAEEAGRDQSIWVLHNNKSAGTLTRQLCRSKTQTLIWLRKRTEAKKEPGDKEGKGEDELNKRCT